MLDPFGLLAVARFLADASGHEPTQARLRRAVSTAYYALFHKVLRSAAERFLGPGLENSGGYGILYRSFDHAHMRRICEDLQISTLKDKTKVALRRSSVGQEVRDFAGIFPDLQAVRHVADYDPAARFLHSAVSSRIDAAEVAMEAFDRIEPDEKADVLALLMVRARP